VNANRRRSTAFQIVLKNGYDLLM
jgi:hypothetical protein